MSVGQEISLIDVLKKHFGFTSFKGNQEAYHPECTGRK